jgi:integrase
MILKPDAIHTHYRVRWREGARLRQETVASYEAATLLDAKKKVARGQASPPVNQPNIRLAEYAAEWLKQIDVAPKTKVSYAESLSTYILPVLGALKVRQIHREHIRQLLARAAKRDGTPLSKNSRRLIRATCSVLLGDAVEEGIISSNPVIGLARKGRKHASTLSPADRQRSIRPLSYEQLALCLRAAQQHCSKRDALLFLALADTGMRPSEALALRWPDLDTIGRTIQVERAVTLGGKIGPTKTEESRTVDVSTRLAEALADWQASIEAEALVSNRTPPAYVFPSRTGKPLEAPTIARQFQALLRRAGLPRFRLYDLRHTYASQLLAENAPITYVSDQLGHAKPTTTLQFYARWIPRGGKAYIDRLTLAREAAAAKTLVGGDAGAVVSR